MSFQKTVVKIIINVNILHVVNFKITNVELITNVYKHMTQVLNDSEVYCIFDHKCFLVYSAGHFNHISRQ